MAAAKGNQYAKGNKGGGRKTDYRPEYAKLAYRMALLGATDEEFAAAVEVGVPTLHRWKLQHQEFSKALRRGKLAADADVAESLYARATGYSHEAVKIFMPGGADDPVYAPYTEHYPPDTTAASLWLRNRQSGKWRDKQEHEHAGPGGGPIVVVSGVPRSGDE